MSLARIFFFKTLNCRAFFLVAPPFIFLQVKNPGVCIFFRASTIRASFLKRKTSRQGNFFFLLIYFLLFLLPEVGIEYCHIMMRETEVLYFPLEKEGRLLDEIELKQFFLNPFFNEFTTPVRVHSAIENFKSDFEIIYSLIFAKKITVLELLSKWANDRFDPPEYMWKDIRSFAIYYVYQGETVGYMFGNIAVFSEDVFSYLSSSVPADSSIVIVGLG